MEPEVVRLAREQHAALLARDAQVLQALTRRWLGVEQGLQGAMERLARQLDQMRANGQVPSRNQLYRLQRYAELLAAAQREIAQYTAWSAGKIAGEQEQSVEQGLTDAQALIGSEMRDTGLVGNFGRLYPEAVNVMAGYASDGSPLSQLLAVSYPTAVEGLTQALIDGIAQGLGPRATARKMANGLGMGLDRALLIARDQTMRAYRTANDQQYEASGVVIGKERLCAHDGRTCLACLAADGEILPLAQPMFDHPQGRCSMRPLTRLSKPRAYESGEQWFMAQPEAEQRRMMGDKRYEAWRAGQFKFADLAAVTHHDVWGDGLRVRTLAELGVETHKPVATGRPRHVMGYTFFKGALGSVAEARAIGERPDGWAKHERVFKDEYLPRHKVKDDVERTLGLWGAPEPSFNARVKGRRRNILALAKEWGKDYNQDAMALLLPNKKGTGGALAWDFGRALSDAELDKLLGGIQAVNDRAAKLGAESGEEQPMVGLTVKGNRHVEYWVPDQHTGDKGQELLEEAMRLAALPVPPPTWTGGYDFKLLFQGADYGA